MRKAAETCCGGGFLCYRFATLLNVTFDEMLQHYHEVEPRAFANGTVFTKPGVRGYPELHPAAALFSKAEVSGGALLDASGSAGTAAFAVHGKADEAVVLEPSRAALRCAQRTFTDMPRVALAAGAVWDAPAAGADTVLLIPATDRGNLRVAAELAGAHAALRDGGAVYIAMHKDQGAKRYEKLATNTFGNVEVVAKSGGWRLARALKGGEAQPLNLVEFEAASLSLVAEPGVYAAGKLDPGTALLLETFDVTSVTGKRVLDLGCGYGLLALKASLAGAEVTALDDDLAAVRSTYRNAKNYGLDLRVLHSDVASELRPDERFDLVLMNPPFHVGKGVRLELPHAFIAAAHEHLSPGGEMVLVANAALHYEPLLARFAYWETLETAKGFKVLRALR